MKLEFNFSMKCVEVRNMNAPELNIGQITAFQILGLALYIVLHYIASGVLWIRKGLAPKSEPWRTMEQKSGSLGEARNNKIVLDKG